jgi:hypothetical protein
MRLLVWPGLLGIQSQYSLAICQPGAMREVIAAVLLAAEKLLLQGCAAGCGASWQLPVTVASRELPTVPPRCMQDRAHTQVNMKLW